MLMSCYELQKIKARNAMVEGDSFTVFSRDRAGLNALGNWRIGWRRFTMYQPN